MRNGIFKLFVGCALLLVPFAAINTASAETPTAIEDTSAVGELAYWNKVKGSEDPAALKLYLDTFPQGMFYDIALSKYLAAGGSPSKLDTPAAAAPPKVEEATEEPEVAVEVDEPAEEAIVPKVKVQKVKKAFFKPKSDYRKIQKARKIIKKREAKRYKNAKYEPVKIYKRPLVKPKYIKVKAKPRYVKPKRKLIYAAKKKPRFGNDDGQGSSYSGGTGLSGGGGEGGNNGGGGTGGGDGGTGGGGWN